MKKVVAISLILIASLSLFAGTHTGSIKVSTGPEWSWRTLRAKNTNVPVGTGLIVNPDIEVKAEVIEMNINFEGAYAYEFDNGFRLGASAGLGVGFTWKDVNCMHIKLSQLGLGNDSHQDEDVNDDADPILIPRVGISFGYKISEKMTLDYTIGCGWWISDVSGTYPQKQTITEVFIKNEFGYELYKGMTLNFGLCFATPVKITIDKSDMMDGADLGGYGFSFMPYMGLSYKF